MGMYLGYTMELAHELFEVCLEAYYVVSYTQVQERRNKEQVIPTMGRNLILQKRIRRS